MGQRENTGVHWRLRPVNFTNDVGENARDVTTPYRVDLVWVLLTEFAKPWKSIGKHHEVQNEHVRKVTLKMIFTVFRTY